MTLEEAINWCRAYSATVHWLSGGDVEIEVPWWRGIGLPSDVTQRRSNFLEAVEACRAEVEGVKAS